jgi:hypothetical protein
LAEKKRLETGEGYRTDSPYKNSLGGFLEHYFDYHRDGPLSTHNFGQTDLDSARICA